MAELGELQVGYAQRDGLVLHDIGINDKGRLRLVMKRASMAEMVVPYDDPRGANFRRNAFDTGEIGMGVSFDSLSLGCDCLGHIHYFDIWSHANRAIDNEDIVVWHRVNYHHWPRPEDWLVQPVVYAGFHWMPDRFFDENPTMDLPRRE